MRRWCFNIAALLSLFILLMVMGVGTWLGRIGFWRTFWIEFTSDTIIVLVKNGGGLRPLFVVPSIVVAVGSVILPFLWISSRRLSTQPSEQQARAPLCDYCGYDLRGTPSRCPECGKTPFR